jgi:surface antigen
MKNPMTRVVVGALIAITLALAVPPAAYADPPSWAPAHGWRKKNDPYYTGYSGRNWNNDYGIMSGRCNRAAVGAAVGAVVGGAVGSQIGKGDGRSVAIILGSVFGAMIGSSIGRDMDQADRACLGHALELAKDSSRVAWTNPDTGVDYLVTPQRGFTYQNRPCREYTTRITSGGRSETVAGKACQNGDGVWETLR